MKGAEPIVVQVKLYASPARAFEAFTARFAEWWPVESHSLSRHAQTQCVLHATSGGAIEERAPDGVRHRWGTVESIEPGRRLRFSWHPGREPDSAQWVEFAAHGDGSRVTLTHGGWEALGEIAPILRREYIPGWRDVLGETFAGYVRGLR